MTEEQEHNEYLKYKELLLPCPICKGKAEFSTYSEGVFVVGCIKGYCAGKPICGACSYEEAAIAWNEWVNEYINKIKSIKTMTDDNILNELMDWTRIYRNEGSLNKEERFYFKSICNEVANRKLLSFKHSMIREMET